MFSGISNMKKSPDRESTLLIVPANDAEAMQIIHIAEKLGMKLLVSDQPHGARLSNEKDLLKRIKDSGASHVVIVEIPGPVQEHEIKDAGYKLTIIDHHRYDELDRATDKETGVALPSSLEQFLALFDISNDELLDYGFDPILVRGIGAMDRGFLSALEEDGYSEEDIKRVSAHALSLTIEARGSDEIERNNKAGEEAWEKRKQVGEFIVVESDEPEVDIRAAVSMLSAKEHGRVLPLIISSRSGQVIYVQDTPKAKELYEHFGGFTFGQDRCWGYNNASAKDKITLRNVIEVLGI